MAPTVWHVIVPGRLLGGGSRPYQSWHFQIGVGGGRRIGTKGRMGGGGTGEPWILAECHKVSEEGA